ncbi:MAG: cation:proton antiporter [Burkholderiales bacterium]
MNILAEVLVLLVLSVTAVAALRRLRLPPIVGYVMVGAAAGPQALGWLSETATIHFLGELGIAFLLFTLGLEFSIAQLASMKRMLLVVGGAQVLAGTAFGAAIARMLGLTWEAALVVGCALAMSSTAIVVKQLRDQLELQTPHGRLAVGILLFQDIAAIPFLVVIPILAQSAEGALGLPLALAIAKGVGISAVMLAVGRYALRPLLHEAGKSTELFTLTALLVALAAAWLTQLSGLSLAFGAFLAGMMLSQTEYRHQVENEIRPFRDVLLGLFFIVVGMQLDPASIAASWPAVALLLAGLVIGKGALVMLLARAYGYRAPEAFRTGLVVAQGGEFSVALLALGLGSGVFSAEASQPVLAAIVLSMLIAPLLIRRAGSIVERFTVSRDAAASGEAELAQALQAMRDHVVVCGYGRVGRQLSRIVAEQGFRFAALDLDPDRVKRAWEAGEQVFYGDATQRGILRAAGLETARALVVSFDHLEASFKVVHEARAINRTVPILVRATDDSALDRLLDAGATEVVPETLEGSLMLATQLLLLLGSPGDRVLELMQAIRTERYRLLLPSETADERTEVGSAR